MRKARPYLVAARAVALGLVAVLAACGDANCIDGGASCRMATPCRGLAYSCTTGALDLFTIDATHTAPGGEAALGRTGDVLLKNDRVVAVIAGLGDQNYIELSGGSLLDLQPVGGDRDALNQVITAVGVLPRDSAAYTSMEIIDERPTRVAVQLRGTLYSQPDTVVTTLFELRPCEPGIRVRSAVWNGTGEPQPWTLTDGYYWSGREPLPFTPGKGEGFRHRSLDLNSVSSAFRSAPFLAASSHAGPGIAYGEVGCVEKSLSGFQNEYLSSFGEPRQILEDRGVVSFERMIFTAARADVAAVADLALDARKQLFEEEWVTLSGSVQVPAAPAGAPYTDQYSIVIAEGTPASSITERTPWTQVVPGVDGTWSARVPKGKTYVLELDAFGRDVEELALGRVDGDVSVPMLVAPATARVLVQVQDPNGAPLDAEVFVVPSDEASVLATTGSFQDQQVACTPWLGPSSGGSPSCNRFLTWHGNPAAVEVEVPLGNFWLYATHGPFWSLARQAVTLGAGDSTPVTLVLTALDVKPQGSLSGDFHVHGAASFDSSIPDWDRVLSFAAADLDVGVATDHDIVTDYSMVAAQLGLTATRSWVTGDETTGHMPFLSVPGVLEPVVIGHYNFWPLRYDPTVPRNGGPFDELLEPGALFDRVEPLFTGTPIRELNHPWAPAQAGRDFGFPRALEMNTLVDLPDHDDGTSSGIYVRTPGGRANDSHDAQEVMNGSQNDVLLQYRAFWWYLLNQGMPKSGTANSDSHALSDEQIGSPRNIVFTDTVPGTTFDVSRMNEAVLAGRLFGTNGPMIDASIVDTQGGQDVELPYGMAVLHGVSATARLHIGISAAPWVPVDEVRIIVNGMQVQKLTGLPALGDAFGTTGLLRFTTDVPLSTLLAGITTDAWIVVEAGTALPLAADLGGGLKGAKDGIPDTGDNNGDGIVDDDDIAPGNTSGPLALPAPPAPTSPLFHFHQVIDGYPFAFTNPFLIDRDGNGRFDRIGVHP